MPLGPGPVLASVERDGGCLAKRGASRYDYVKVRVWIQNHSHVLSRFLVSRLLSAAGLQPRDALKVALELKKQLVDRGALDVPVEVLYRDLFALVRRFNYEDAYVDRFRHILRFYQHKRPMLVLLGGLGCLAAPSLGSRLAGRLNVSTVLSTSTAFAVSLGERHAVWENEWARDTDAPPSLAASYAEQCAVVRRALQGDLDKALKDGKATIVEGPHLCAEDMSSIVLQTHAPTGGVVVPMLLQLPQEWGARECLPASSGAGAATTSSPMSLAAIGSEQNQLAGQLDIPQITVDPWDYDETVQTMYELAMAHIDVAIAGAEE